MKLIVEGMEPLVGRVKASGSRNAALKIIIASLFCNEDVVLENVPRIESVLSDLEIIQALGTKVEWLSSNKLLINASSMSSFEIPEHLGSRFRTAALLAGPLLYRFGNAKIPKYTTIKAAPTPINRWVEAWDQLGFTVEESPLSYFLRTRTLTNAQINFKINTVMGTENAILSSLFIPGETTINGAAQEPEVDDLIKFLNVIGAKVKRVSERKIIVQGVSAFTGGKYSIMPDRNEVVTFAVASLVTGGDVEIEDAVSGDLLPFMRKLEAMKASFEFRNNSLRVWKSKTQKLEAVNIETAPAPGFMTDWQPLITLLLTQATGVGYVHETIYTDRFSYVKELNRMGAKISLLQPSQIGMEMRISDDSYDYGKLGEPYTVARIEGPTQLRREKVSISDFRAGATIVLAALSAEGRSEIFGFENVNRGYEHFDEKLKMLGAKIISVD